MVANKNDLCRLIDNDGIYRCPITKSDGVFMPDGNTTLTKKIQGLDEQLETITNKTPWDYLDSKLVVNNDWSKPLQYLIDSGAKKILLPKGTINFNTPINITNRDLNGVLICGDTMFGTTIVANTGSCVFDCTGTQGVQFKDLSIIKGVSNPSSIGIIFGRSKSNNYAQFSNIDNVSINLGTKPTLNGGLGTVCIFNYGAELFRCNNIYVIGDTPCIFTNNNTLYPQINSQFTDFWGVVTSMSAINISNTSTIVSKGGNAFELSGVIGLDLENIYVLNESSNDINGIKVISSSSRLNITGHFERLTKFLYTDSVINNLNFDVTSSSPTYGNEHIIIDGSQKLSGINQGKIIAKTFYPSDYIYSTNLVKTFGSITNGLVGVDVFLSDNQNINIYICKGLNVYCSNSNNISINQQSVSSAIIHKDNTIELMGDIKTTNMKLTLLNKTIDFGTTAPTTGTYNTGSVRFNSTCNIGTNSGWQCISGGTPGTWREFGQVGYQQNSGSPIGVITPKFIGEDMFDILNKHWYKSIGVTNNDWKQITN